MVKYLHKVKGDSHLGDIDRKYYELWNLQGQHYKDEVSA
jgi:hypothetical protein